MIDLYIDLGQNIGIDEVKILNPTGKNGQGKNLISLQQALSLNRAEIRKMHKQYGNSGLASVMGMLNFDKHFVKAEGVSVWDSDGNKYLDFLGGYGSLNLGHNHPKILAALREVDEIPSLIQASLPALAGALAHNLAGITPGELQRSFFCNSGAEAVEGALKLARAATGRADIIYCDNSFHGKTFGALSVTGREKYRKPFEPLLPACHAIPFGDTDALGKVMRDLNPAAFIVEPVQGEGGIITPPQGYLKEVQRICKKYGALLIVDEIQTGLGRTGKMFACEHYEVEPDILCLAKSLGGGVMPIGAFVTRDALWRKAYGGIDKATLHTSTFGGNSRAAAAGLATIEVIYQEKLVEKAEENGRFFMKKLNRLKEKYPLIKDVRGQGLMIGLEFNEVKGLGDKLSLGITSKVSKEYMGSLVAGELMNNYKIITAYTLNNPNVIRLEPPLTVSREEIEAVCNALEEILSKHRGFFSVAASGAKTIFKTFKEKK